MAVVAMLLAITSLYYTFHTQQKLEAMINNAMVSVPITVDLPEAKTSQEQSTVELIVTKDLTWHLNGEELLEEELEDQLIKATNENTLIKLKADRTVPVEKVTLAMTIAKEHHLKIALVTE